MHLTLAASRLRCKVVEYLRQSTFEKLKLIFEFLVTQLSQSGHIATAEASVALTRIGPTQPTTAVLHGRTRVRVLLPARPLVLSALLRTQLTLTVFGSIDIVELTVVLLIVAVVLLGQAGLFVFLVLVLSLPLLLLVALVLRHDLVSPLVQLHLLLLMQ